MGVGGRMLRLTLGIASVVGVLSVGDDRFRDRPLLSPYPQDEGDPRRPADIPPDYSPDYDYDYYDDAQPQPPSRLDKILPLVTYQCRAEGYYADPEFNCEVFHYCSADGTRFTFLCGEGSKFHQKTLICDFDHNLRCGGDGTLQELEAPQDTLSTEHLFPAGEIMKMGVATSGGTSNSRQPPPPPPPSASRRRPPPASSGPAQADRRPERHPQVFPRPLPARRRQDTLPLYTDRPGPDRRRESAREPAREPARGPVRGSERSSAQRRAEDPELAPARPLDRYQAAAPPQRRQGGPEDGYQAVLNDIHGLIRDTEAFQLPVLPLLTPAERRQDGAAGPEEEEEASPPPRLHIPKRRSDSYGPLRRPLLRRRQRQVFWEDQGLLALRDIVDSKVSRFFPERGAPAAERRAGSAAGRQRDFNSGFSDELDGFPEKRFDAPHWPAPVENEIAPIIERSDRRLPERTSTGRQSGGRSVRTDAAEDDPVNSAEEPAQADFGSKLTRSEDVADAQKSTKTSEPLSETEDTQESKASASTEKLAGEPLVDLETAATTESFNAAEYGTPKASSILTAAESDELAEPVQAASSEVSTRRRPRRQKLQRRQLIPRNQGVDQLRQLQRFSSLGRPLQILPFAPPQPGQPFVNTQFVNVRPSSLGRAPEGDAASSPADGQQQTRRRVTAGRPPAFQSDFRTTQPFPPSEDAFFQSPPTSPPAFRRPAGVQTDSRQSGGRAIGTQTAEQSFTRPQQSFARPQQDFNQLQQDFPRPVFQDSQRFGAPPRQSVVTIADPQSAFRPASTSFSSSTGFGASSSAEEQTGEGRPDDGRFQTTKDARFPQPGGVPSRPPPGPQRFQPPGAVQFGRPTGAEQDFQQGFPTGLIPAPNALGFNTFVAPQFAPTFQRLPSSPPPSAQKTPGSTVVGDSNPASGPARFIPTRPPAQFFAAPRVPTVPSRAPFTAFRPQPGPLTTTRPAFALPTVPPAAAQTTFPVTGGSATGTTPPTVLQQFEEEVFGRPTRRPLDDVSQSIADDVSQSIADDAPPPAPHISTPLPVSVIAALAGVTEPSRAPPATEPTVTELPPTVTEPLPPTAPAPATSPTAAPGRRRFRTRRPGGGRRRRPRPTVVTAVTDPADNEVTDGGDPTPADDVVKDSGFTLPTEETTDAPSTSFSAAPTRRGRPSRRRLSGRRQTTTAAPAAAAADSSDDEPAEEASSATEAPPSSPTGSFRRRRPSNRGGRFRARSRKRLRGGAARNRLQLTEEKTAAAEETTGNQEETIVDQEETTSTHMASPSQEEADDERADSVTQRPRRRRPLGVASDRARRPLRRRNRVRTTAQPSTEPPAGELVMAVGEAAAEVTKAAADVEALAAKVGESGTDLVKVEEERQEEEGIRATAADLRQMREREEAAAAEEEEEDPISKTTRQRLKELFERRRKDRLSFRRQRPSRRRRPAATADAEQQEESTTDQVESEAAAAEGDTTAEEVVNAPRRRVGSRRGTSRRLTLPRQRLRFRVTRPAPEDTEVTVRRVETPAEESTESPAEQTTTQSTEQPTERPTEQPTERPTERPGRPARRRFRPDRIRGRPRTRPSIRSGGRVSTLASLLVESSDPATTTSVPVTAAPTTAAPTNREEASTGPASAEPTNAESLAAVNLEGSNMEGRGDPPKRTLLGSVRQRGSTAAEVTRTTITPVLVETENPAPRATRPLGSGDGESGQDAAPPATESAAAQTEGDDVSTGRPTPEYRVTQTAAPPGPTTSERATAPSEPTTSERTTPGQTARTSTPAVRTTTEPATVQTTEQPAVSTKAEPQPPTTTTPRPTDGPTTTESPEFIPFDTSGEEVSLDSIVEQVTATKAPTPQPAITMATDSPLLPLQSLFAGF